MKTAISTMGFNFLRTGKTPLRLALIVTSMKESSSDEANIAGSPQILRIGKSHGKARLIF